MKDKVNFVGIGPGKSGTTWIYLALKSHPSVAISKVKETNYFNDNFHRGENWYHNLFPIDSRKTHGEISNTYIFDKTVPKKIYSYNPQMKIISVLRDPIERAVSHYFFLKRNGATYGNFSDAILDRPDLLSRGLYFSLLSNYAIQFSRDQLFIRTFDDFKFNTEGFYGELCEFLGIANLYTQMPESSRLSSSAPRSAYLARLAKYSALKVRSMGFPIVVESLKRSSLSSILYKKTSYDLFSEVQDNLGTLISYYDEDVSALSEFMGMDLKKTWFSKYAESPSSEGV